MIHLGDITRINGHVVPPVDVVTGEEESMRILVACEESQAVTIELRNLGHEAYSCDLEPCSGGHPEWHLQADALELLKLRWDMILAFPPCTYLSNAGNRWLYQDGQLNRERYQKGLEAKAFFLRFLEADCPKVAVENPISSRVYEMPPANQEIQPFMFGHPFTKKTRLWLRGLPPLMATDIVPWEHTWCPSSRSGNNGYAKRSGKERAKTFPGIARAMAEQWAGKCEEGQDG